WKVWLLDLNTFSLVLPFFSMILLCFVFFSFQIRSERVVPVFIVNLLISDILQVACMAVHISAMTYGYIFYLIITYYGFVIASVYFMTLIALERYLMIAHPLWYRFNKIPKISVPVSVVTWIISILISFVSLGYPESSLLIPLPFMIFSLVGTFRSLYTVQAVPAAEKRRIVGILIVVFLTYTVVFLPYVLAPLMLIFATHFHIVVMSFNFLDYSCMLIQISPLTDIFLYIFLKKWFLDKLLTFLCCCIKNRDDGQQTVTETESSTSKGKDNDYP
uniref:G-protein coupled receptors family 1 profile domain-containing protein n=1 Tax=Cyprinodon variegatus TaxID=28743 RepID=A0A3Q2D298_CYPVA